MLLEQSPPQPSTPTDTLRGIPDGIGGVRATLAAMRQAAIQASVTLEVRSLAESIVENVPPKDFKGELEAIQDWVRTNIRYTRDPLYAETLKLPRALLEARQGDCDDQATLVAALALSIGFKPRFVAIGTTQYGSFDHVYTEVKLGSVQWVSVETTENVELGWQPPGVKARFVFNF